jgi:hypothetical protein
MRGHSRHPGVESGRGTHSITKSGYSAEATTGGTSQHPDITEDLAHPGQPVVSAAEAGPQPGPNGVRGLVLSLFPGADLLGRAFEALGWCVVRGPDILWGGDVQAFHAPPGVFDGVIGGPPCQVHSKAAQVGTSAEDRIPEFLRVVDEAKPRWAVMEGVPETDVFIPGWSRICIRDWDCGGLTHRRRSFWVMGVPAVPVEKRRPGRPAHSVLASNWRSRTGKSGKGGTKGMHQVLSPSEAARLQGYPGLDVAIMKAQPGGVSDAGRRCLAIHMLGNGVPRAMADYVAQHVTTHAEVRHG